MMLSLSERKHSYKKPARLSVGLLMLCSLLTSGCAEGNKVAGSPDTQKINSNLLNAERISNTRHISFSAAAASLGIVTINGRVVLDIVTSRIDRGLEKQLLMTGAGIRHIAAKYNRISLEITSPSQLYQLAKISEVQMIQPEYGGTTHGGAVGNPGQLMPKTPKILHKQ